MPYSITMAMPMVYRVSAAKYLPSTIPGRETGAVSRPWSVFCFSSSLNSRMVRIGIRNTMTMNRLENKPDISVVALYRLLA